MDNIKRMIERCEFFLEGKCSIEEFQQRLLTFTMSELSSDLYEFIPTLENELAEIRFCYDEIEHLRLSTPYVIGFREILFNYASRS
ncbi:MAG: hypothetical protein NAG76_17335 [Candidatus Pristimantibacillus lignocellulolyticus]|uniref:Uncharacterized protein n=1 Tax=Candidatus Pristimantibacillus lignocellulolyticus TaxID=2994561 RepID=A0A9J6ZC22_9BACL|nr:MAG: hypothetical protein NAG76_17335 [Candidatus Pristimantibacillus lignocellulolyticus]